MTFTSLLSFMVLTIIRTKEQNVSTNFYYIFKHFTSWILFFLIRSKVALHAFTMQSMKNYINAKTISRGFNRGDGIEILKRNDLYLAFLWHYRNDWNFFF